MKPGDLFRVTYKDQHLAAAVEELGVSHQGQVGIILEHVYEKRFIVLLNRKRMELISDIMEPLDETR